MHDSPRSQRVVLAALLALQSTALAACGGTMQFSDSSALVITGEPPAPPPPPPKEEPPPPPKPKRVEVTADKIVIHEKIQFELDKATIKADSNGLLDEIVQVIQENPHILKISIEGHTDDQGADKYNQKLSDQRAKSVLEYLTGHGIPDAKLTAKGFGESKPIASNATEEGKEQNRRVEFIITEQGEVKKVYEIDPKTGEKKEVLTPEQKEAAKKAKAEAKEKAKEQAKLEKAEAKKVEADKKAADEAAATDAKAKAKAEKEAAKAEKEAAKKAEADKKAEEKKAAAEKKAAEKKAAAEAKEAEKKAAAEAKEKAKAEKEAEKKAAAEKKAEEAKKEATP